MFLRLVLLASMLALSSGARAFEKRSVPPLLFKNHFVLEAVNRDAEAVCPGSALPTVCEEEFRLAQNSLMLAARVMQISAIAHPGEEANELLQHAERLHEKGWGLYLDAVMEYMPSPVAATEAAKAEERK